MTALSRPLRLAEATGVLSLATDLAMGQQLEHGLRTAVLAVRIAQALDLSEDDQVTVFYTGMLHFAGCTAESEIDARFFGDELSARPQMIAVAFGTRLDLVATAARVAHPERARLARAAAVTRSAFGGVAEFRRWAASHCDVARVLGARLYRLAEPEIGWVRVTSKYPALAEGPWPSWHRDGFGLPAGAAELAANEVCVQAFSLGPHTAVQFHPEATQPIVASWLAGSDPPPPRDVTDPLFRDADAAWQEASANAGVFFSAWLDGWFCQPLSGVPVGEASHQP